MSASSPNILERFSEPELATLVEAFPIKTLAAGDFLCQYGEKAQEMFIIVSGEVEVLRPKRRAGEYDVTTVLGAGQISGEAALMGVFPRSASMKARDEVKVMIIPKAGLAPLKKSNPRLVMSLFEGIFIQMGDRFQALKSKKTQELF